jgi:hypothetical protein
VQSVACVSLRGWGMLQDGSRGFESLWSHLIFFSIYPILPAAIGPGIYSASNSNEYQKVFTGSKVRLARKADNLNAFYKTIIWTKWDPHNLISLSACTAC